VLLCSSFALMSQGFSRGAERPTIRSRHPEAPQPGERLLYVDLNRERLEALYQQAS
jgi:hypothetical protein